MGNTGGLALVAVLALTGCTAATAEPASTYRGEVQPAGVAAFVSAVQKSDTDYSSLPPADIAGMAQELCQHYDGGFTTEDLRNSAGDKLAEAGEAARLTVCPAK
jgi:hypothetical protein